jgi:hypothetical protein
VSEAVAGEERESAAPSTAGNQELSEREATLAGLAL